MVAVTDLLKLSNEMDLDIHNACGVAAHCTAGEPCLVDANMIH
jgi:hypothetical protein